MTDGTLTSTERALIELLIEWRMLDILDELTTKKSERLRIAMWKAVDTIIVERTGSAWERVTARG